MSGQNIDKIALSHSFDEKLFGLLITSITDHAIFMTDPNGFVISWNQGAQNIKGYHEDEIIGKHISIFYISTDNKLNTPRQDLNKALKNGSYEKELWLVRKDDTVFWAHLAFTTVYNDNGHLVGFAVICRDVTERRNREEKREEINAELEKRVEVNTAQIVANEIRYRKLIENSYDGLSLLNEKMEIIYRSRSAERISGYNNTERNEHEIDDLVHPADRLKVNALIAEVLSKPGVPIISSYRTKHKQGHYIWVESLFTNWLNDQNIKAIVCNFSDITQRVMAEEELKAKNEQIESILGSITDGFIALDKDLCYTYANKRIGELMGRDPASLIGKYIWSEFPDAVDSESYKAFHRALSKREFVTNEDHYPARDLWHENFIYPAADGGLSVFVRDISERKKAEQEVRQLSETQAAILNALPPNIVLVNTRGKILAVNESWKKLALANNLGMPNYGIGYNYLVISEKATGVDKVNAARIEHGIREVMQGSKKEFKMQYPSLSGNDWFEVVVSPLADKSLKGAVILHINITDRKRAEAAMEQSEANLRTVFEHIDLSAILFDENMKIVSFNTNALNDMIRHFNKRLKIGNSMINYFPKERRVPVKQAFEAAKQRQISNYEAKYALPDGGSEWYEIKWVGVENDQGQIIGVVLTFKNITAKKTAEFERENMTADLAQRNMDLEQFTYIISHNLRAPVANIQGLASLLDDTGADTENSDTLHALSASVNNLDKIIIDLNHILQVRNQVNDKIETVSLTTLVDEIKLGIGDMVSKNNVTINCNFKAADQLHILKSYLYSILQNLIINSIKYRRPEADPVISIVSKVKNGKLTISVKDNGKGIDLDKYGQHIFGLYKRFDRSVEGKGVGLFMVKMQVESLGGTVHVQSKPDAGTEFTLEFASTIKED